MTLTLEHEWEIPIGDGFKTHVGLADASEFVKLMEDDKNERLFAQNVRTDLGSQINIGIKKTYETEPDKFWLYNNGLYIICSQIDYLEGHRRKLKYPSIINGSQTLHSIKHASKHQPCKILVRILVMDTATNPELLSAVIRRTNTQNPMELINLSSQDPFQLNIARYLDRYHIFYERREKEWSNEKKYLLPDYIPISVKEVTQWLSLLHYLDIGFGLARTKVSDLFQPTYYNRIFSSFDTHYSSTSFKDLALMVWAGFFTKNMIKYLPKSLKAFGKMSQLVLIRATYDAIKANRTLQDNTLKLLNNHMFDNASTHSSLKNWYRSAVKEFATMQKKAQRRDAQLDFSNYFKRNNLTLTVYKRVCNKTSTQKLGKLLMKHLDQME